MWNLKMRIEVISEDRLGISQEILTALAALKVDIKAMEVTSQRIFAHLDDKKIAFSLIEQALMTIAGVNSCKLIDLLPAESRERHLKALLNRLPDAIIDIDDESSVIAMNKSGESLLRQQHKLNSTTRLEGRKITELLEFEIDLPLFDRVSSQTIEIAGQSYIAEIAPITEQGNSSGAVISIKSISQLGRQIAILQTREEHAIDHIIGSSAGIQLLKEQTSRFAELDLPVLINGETGTGKELVARALHNASHRKKAPFLAVNCAALPEHLLESELFGYATGAFTGAQKGGKPGLFELAEGGTVFLDEIAEMSSYLQAKLLRFLQDFTYRRLGGTKELHANVRIVSATHQNLLNMIAKQQFREDLFYRLNVLNLTSPPLRDRAEDINLLVNHFIVMAADQMNLSKPIIETGAMQLLTSYTWPGNIRELQNVLFRAVALNESGDITSQNMAVALAQVKQTEDVRDVLNDNDIESWASAQAQFEKKLISDLYPYYPTTRKLAERLKVSHNKIAMKLRQFNLKL